MRACASQGSPLTQVYTANPGAERPLKQARVRMAGCVQRAAVAAQAHALGPITHTSQGDRSRDALTPAASPTLAGRRAAGHPCRRAPCCLRWATGAQPGNQHGQIFPHEQRPFIWRKCKRAQLTQLTRICAFGEAQDVQRFDYPGDARRVERGRPVDG
jgi:hypothetical protein